MKYTLLLLLVACSLITYGQEKSYDYCYYNNKGICVYSVADNTEQVMTKNGWNPCISPDGKKIVYSVFSVDKPDHRIAIMDLNTRKETLLYTGNNPCSDLVWSPNGKLIAYNFYNEQNNKFDIAVMDINNTSSPQILTGKVKRGSFKPSWQAGSKNVVVQDWDKLYVLDLSGNIITTYKITDLIKTDNASDMDKFVFATDNKKIVFSKALHEPEVPNGTPSSLYVYDIDSRSTLRLSPKGYAIMNGNLVIKNNQILFAATENFQAELPIYHVYIIDMDGKNLKLLFKDCWNISAKN